VERFNRRPQAPTCWRPALVRWRARLPWSRRARVPDRPRHRARADAVGAGARARGRRCAWSPAGRVPLSVWSNARARAIVAARSWRPTPRASLRG